MSADSAPESRPPLVVVKGDATAEEVAALVTVLQGMAAASAAAAAGKADPAPLSQWGAPARRLRTTLPHGPGAWRASGLPR